MLLKSSDVLDGFIIRPEQKKCFIFDLDGTIVFGGKPLSQENETLLLRIKDAGHEIVFATGRTWRDFKQIMPEWTYEHFLVLFNGSLSVLNGEVKRSQSLDAGVARKIIDICVAHNYPFIVDNLSHFYHPLHLDLSHNEILGPVSNFRLIDLEQIFASDIYKILILDPEAEMDFRDYAHEHGLILKVHSYDKCFDLVLSGVNKHNGVDDYLNFDPQDVFVFGNDFNDYELLANYPNSTLLGDNPALVGVAKLRIPYSEYLQHNFTTLISTILGEYKNDVI